MRQRLIMILVCVVVGTSMSCEKRAAAQGIERESLSGSGVAEELRQSGDDRTYNLKLGPVTLRADASLPVSYNDNINVARTGRISDFIMTPEMDVRGRWAVTDLNTLTFNVGIGYEAYLTHSQFNDVIVTPDSEARFNFFIGDVALNVHDVFSYEQDPTEVGQLSNQTRLARFQNDAGLGATWDLSALVLELDYDHANLWVTQNTFDYLTNQSDTFAPKITIPIGKTIKTGFDFSYSNVRYSKSFENDYSTYSAGPFVSDQFSKNLSVQAQVGGFVSEYARGGQNGDSSDLTSYYASLGVTHRINEFVTESLTGGRESIPGLTSNFTERVYANYGANWQATSSLNIGGTLFWENLTDSAATVSEKSNRYGVGLEADENFARHMTLTFNYQYILKDANPSFDSYYQNVGTLGVRYSF